MDGREIYVKSAYSVPRSEFKMPSQPCPISYDNPDIYTLFDGMDLEAIDKSQIGILIGAGVPEALLIDEVKRGRDAQPLAVKTMFGWTLFGSSKPGHELNVSVLHARKERF